jgi:hypothetical protein
MRAGSNAILFPEAVKLSALFNPSGSEARFVPLGRLDGLNKLYFFERTRLHATLFGNQPYLLHIHAFLSR